MADSQPIFGLSDEQIQALQQAANQNQAAQVAQMGGQQGPSLYYRNLAGQQIGQAISGAMGYQDPMVQKNNLLRQAQQLTDVQARANGWAPMSPEYMNAGVQNLYRVGLPDAAMHAQQVSQDWAAKNAATGMQVAETNQMTAKTKRDQLVQDAANQIHNSIYSDVNLTGDSGNPSNQAQLRQKETQALLNSGIPELQKLGDERRKADRIDPALAPEGEKYRLALEQAMQSGDPKAIKDAQDNYDLWKQTQEKKSLANSSTMERAHQTLIGLTLKKENGEKLTREDILNARQAQSIIEAQSTATRDPNTGAITMVQNRAPDEYSVDSLLGNVRPKVTGEVGHTGGKTVAVLEGPGARPSEGEMTKLSSTDALKGVMADVEKDFKPEYVGPIAGRVGNVLGATIGNSPEQARFRAKMTLYKNRLIKIITGAQMSEQEVPRLMAEIPNELDPSTNFLEKWRAAIENIDYEIKAYKQNMQQGNVRQIGGNPVSPNQTPSKPQLATVPGQSSIPNPSVPNQQSPQNSATPAATPTGVVSPTPIPAPTNKPPTVGANPNIQIRQEGDWTYYIDAKSGVVNMYNPRLNQWRRKQWTGE
jgi:hypothetical protein